MRDPELLRAAIERSGMEHQAFAETVLLRSPRTVRRWAAGTYDLPAPVRAFLEAYLKREKVTT